MKNFRWTLLAALLMAAPQAANAQDPGAPGTTTTAPADAGAITNSTTATETTTTTGISPDATAVDVTPLEGEGTLANTGGAPILMSLSGLALAAGAFGLRRKFVS